MKTPRRPDLRSFDLEMDDGQTTIRNRKDLRPAVTLRDGNSDSDV